jgi:hypothetical protein
MRAFDQGSVFRVTVSEGEAYAFSRQWPASGLGDCGLSFTFERANGDLVDVSGDAGASGGAVLALADDAREYGAKRLGLSLIL